MYLLYLSILASFALAKYPTISTPQMLEARQGEAIDPIEIPQAGSTCASGSTACPGQWEGRTICVYPSRGETCCPQGYGCPGGRYCLKDGLCCRNGLDPQTCARENGVTLPPGFGTSPSVATSTPEPTPSVEASPSVATPAPEPTPSVDTSPTVDTPAPEPTPSVATPPYIIPGNTSTPVETATGSGAVPGPTGAVPFTGAGSLDSASAYGAMAVCIGAGLLRAML